MSDKSVMKVKPHSRASRRNPVAKSLKEAPQFRTTSIPSKKGYDRNRLKQADRRNLG